MMIIFLLSLSPSPEIYVASFDVSLYDGSMVVGWELYTTAVGYNIYVKDWVFPHYTILPLFSDDGPDILIRNNDFPSHYYELLRPDNILTLG